MKRLLLIVGLVFVISVALQTHGSSIGVWRDIIQDWSSPSGVLFFSPKVVRTDEWLAWTPSLLAQSQHNPPFPAENANLGAGKTPLLMNFPVRHYSMFFRPQLYGYFLFNVETAYAFHWNVKIFGLFLSFFFLIRALTGKFWISIFGSSWLYFSAYTQWWFSCPPMLPEMLSCWALAIFCLMQLFRTSKFGARLLAAAGLVVSSINFVLCFYPPFQTPLLYAGAALLAGWFWQNQRTLTRWRNGVLFAGMAVVVIAGVLTPYLIECKPTFDIVAATKYPGERRSHGGDLLPRDTFNGVLGFFNTNESDFLATRDNACEASNFYPLWLLVIGAGAIALWRTRRERRVETMLFLALVFFTFYTLVPFPEWFCRWTLLNYVTGQRALLVIGVLGIILTSLILSKPLPRPRWSLRVSFSLLALFGVLLVLLTSNPLQDPFLTMSRCGLLLGLNALLIGLYFAVPRPVFCGTFLLCLVLNNGAVNPIATGLGPLLDSEVSVAVREIRARDPEAKWIDYAASTGAQFLKAQGADVLNGLSYVPDIPFFRQLDPSGEFDAIYNRYGFSVFFIGEGARKIRLIPPFAYSVDLLPQDPILAQHGAKYALSPKPIPNARAYGLHLISQPAGRIWIYQIAAAE